jgi:hypothetical protein
MIAISNDAGQFFAAKKFYRANLIHILKKNYADPGSPAGLKMAKNPSVYGG